MTGSAKTECLSMSQAVRLSLETGESLPAVLGRPAVADRFQAPADADPALRQALTKLLELDAYLESQAIPAQR